MSTPVNTKNSAFNFSAKHCGLSVEELLTLKDEFSVAGFSWQRLGERVQCCYGVHIITVDRSELLAQVCTDGLEVIELSGDDAVEAISEFAGLELAPPYKTEHEQKLARAGFTTQSPRSTLRADLRADLER